jgi:hypothetical protein
MPSATELRTTQGDGRQMAIAVCGWRRGQLVGRATQRRTPAHQAVIIKTLESTPRDATHWSLRSMAEATGMTWQSVHRIWKAFGLQPHRTETFKLSTIRS